MRECVCVWGRGNGEQGVGGLWEAGEDQFSLYMLECERKWANANGGASEHAMNNALENLFVSV